MYASLILPWSRFPTQAETQYRSAGLLKTKGTIFLLPPSPSSLRQTYNAPPRPKTLMSAGAVALCKHFERDGHSADPSKSLPEHPFWERPVGSNERKSAMAREILEEMLMEAVWRNVIWLHERVAVYEVRNGRGYGMRWTLNVEGESGGDQAEKDWSITKTMFRGFLEPIAGLDHELDGA